MTQYSTPTSQYEQSECTRGGYCNFMHIKPPSEDLKYDAIAWLIHSHVNLQAQASGRPPP